MKSRYLKVCCLIVTAAIMINLLPVQVLGEELHKSVPDSIPEAIQDIQQEIAEQPEVETSEVLGEIPEKRTQFSKSFQMSNGLQMAVVYPEAVHYEDAGQWKDIDNTLVAQGKGTSSGYTNTAGAWNVVFPQSLSADNSVSISRAGHTLRFGMAGEIRLNDRVVNSGGISVAAARNLQAIDVQEQVTSSRASVAEIQPLDHAPIRESMEYPQTFIDKLFSKLRYEEVYANTHIEYDLNSGQVKESIIMERYDSALLGYRYRLETGTMTPILNADGSIALYGPDGTGVIMEMPAPYLVDSQGNRNEDITVRLVPDGSAYLLTYRLPVDWLSAEDRAWPVVLDPVVIADGDCKNVQDQSVMEYYNINYMDGRLYSGYKAEAGITRFYIKFTDIPELSSGDVVVDASMRFLKTTESTSEVSIGVHKVTGDWTSSTLNWSNMPGWTEVTEDYAICQNAGEYFWNVTDIVQDWYQTDVNNGMLFKAPDSVEAARVNKWAQFYSSDYTSVNTYYWPTLTIAYRNTSGLENYWDYTSAAAGRAGTGYVNNYSGNLVWVRGDLGFDGNLMPVSINHIYNANESTANESTANESTANESTANESTANESTQNRFGLGTGWRTNYNQLVYQPEGTSYYIWEDGDGTKHAFYFDGTRYSDEDGLGLSLSITAGTKTITDKYGNTSVFDAANRLIEQKNNQESPKSITITYENPTGYRIYKITDGAGRVYEFSYNSSNNSSNNTNGLLERIIYKGTGDEEISSVTYTYTGELLTQVTDQDGKSSNYAYTGKLLSSITDVDGYQLRYAYTATEQKRVTSVGEYDVSEDPDGVPGGTLSFSYAHNQTTLQDHNGNVQILQFNDWGNLLSVQDGYGRAQFAQYALNQYSLPGANTTATTGKGNQLTLSSKLQNTVINLLKEPGFEHGNNWGSNATALTISQTDDYAHIGRKSLKIVSPAENTYYGAYSPTFPVAPGETVTVSAYVKNPDAAAHLAFHHNDGVTYNTFTGDAIPASSEWVRAEHSYTNDTGATVDVCVYLFALHPGTYYLDDVQVEKTATPSRYNLVHNGDFRHGFYGWVDNTDSLVTVETAAAPELDNTVLRITGSATQSRHLAQTVFTKGGTGDTYVVSAWAKADSVPLHGNREFAVVGTFHYTDGDTESFTARFNPSVGAEANWQYSATAMIAAKAYNEIVVEVVYNENLNKAYFDGIQLFKEEFGTSYAYNDDGEISKVTDIHGQVTQCVYLVDGETESTEDIADHITTHIYMNEDLVKIKQGNAVKMTYTYDTYHNVIRAVSETGVTYKFDYDSYGNVTKTEIINGDSVIVSTSDYTDDGNYLTSTKDPLENETTFVYNEDTGVLESVKAPGDLTESQTNYTYDEMYRLDKATKGLYIAKWLEADYTYTDDLLTGVQTQSTAYSFTYGPFSQRTGVKVGTRNLATYTYTNDRNRYLQQLTYGNGDTVSYTYDDQGRVTRETFENGAYVAYTYDNTGALSTVTDSETGITTRYYYDLTGRMMKYTESTAEQTHSLEYQYDAENKLTRKIRKSGSDSLRVTNYTYDSYDRLISSTTEGLTENITYDGFDRVSSVAMNFLATDRLVKTYTYTPNSTRVSAVTFSSSNEAGASGSYQYGYDSNGNITSVSDGTNITTYVYDYANQLVRENDPITGITKVWEYDDAGNIRSRTEYAYTTGVLGTPTDTVTYTYSDTEWGDLLTGYGSVAFSYDGIGNLTNDGTWIYTWQHGRQLASMSDGIDDWEFTYDANGMRTKRTNGTATYEYIYNGSQLAYMKKGYETLSFVYGANGPAIVFYNQLPYFYVTNLQGDVIGITSHMGNLVVSYTYDAWGNVTSVTGSMAATLGQLNPLRYRGYVYDQETGLYYLQSRYYNPEIGRFINADALVSTGQGLLGYNMFAYCFNNPVNYHDTDGRAPQSCNDPAGEFGQWLGGLLYKWLEKETQEDMAKIANGTVCYISNGSGRGARISNSHEIDTPWVMYQYVAANRSDDIAGTTTGFVVEWVFHNIAYDIGKTFNLESITHSAEHVDVGRTIYSDSRSDFSVQMVMSLGMQLAYTLLSPITAAYDLGVETGRWNHVYQRE